ncbi:SDR family oxidoreductase [Pseudomonas entomophila]|uniref:UDP-glucose 4-epimerase family protein n=1 Tax=Pseudomonas entomophila TaxID=312306 RepID=UPI0015E283CE|nr:SDR family oxidoreductase [Pseudomonas entomophila]MBA1190715.1 SDR family oxidoreductase [Pseudomonas entomophila]
MSETLNGGAVLVTGANGFVGRALVGHLLRRHDHDVVAGVRRPEAHVPTGAEKRTVPALWADAEWTAALAGIDQVVHTAARVHVMDETEADPLTAFRRVNTEGTLALAEQAAKAGVRRFVFISSIKVNGEQTAPGQPFDADQPVAPTDPYGLSKHEAEQGLLRLARDTAMEVVIIRPVLVYGPGVGANFASLMRWLKRGLPLPLGAVRNRRSLVSLDNLVDLIAVCLDHPNAANQVFLVSDGEDLSTTDLLRRLGQALGRRPWLLPVPSQLMALAARLVGRTSITQRLLGSLQVDIGKNRRLLGWQPVVTVDHALRTTAASFLESRP